MKKIVFTAVAACAAFAMTSCGGNAPAEGTEVKGSEEKVCKFHFKAESAEVSWTAFKTPSKVGVGGKFDEVTISGTKDAEVFSDVFAGASFTIPVTSTNTSNPDRDGKIINHFFNNMESTSDITGTLVSLTGDENSGSGIVAIQLNGQDQNVDVNYESKAGVLTLKGAIDVLNWGTQSSLDSLNHHCDALHKDATNPDGESILWPNVDIQLIASFEKTCD